MMLTVSARSTDVPVLNVYDIGQIISASIGVKENNTVVFLLLTSNPVSDENNPKDLH